METLCTDTHHCFITFGIRGIEGVLIQRFHNYIDYCFNLITITVDSKGGTSLSASSEGGAH